MYKTLFSSSEPLKSLLRMSKVKNGTFLENFSSSELFKSVLRMSEVKNGKYLVQDTALEQRPLQFATAHV